MMLKATEVAQRLGISPRAVYDLADAGLLACYRLGVGRGAVRFSLEDVEAYRARKIKPPISPRVLRDYERMRLRAVSLGAEGLPELSESQRAAIAKRVRNERTAPWANRQAIRAIYAEAKRLTQETGVPHHVDHDIPLLGEFVSGLHVETNLRIMLGADNIRKSNKVDLC